MKYQKHSKTAILLLNKITILNITRKIKRVIINALNHQVRDIFLNLSSSLNSSTWPVENSKQRYFSTCFTLFVPILYQISVPLTKDTTPSSNTSIKKSCQTAKTHDPWIKLGDHFWQLFSRAEKNFKPRGSSEGRGGWVSPGCSPYKSPPFFQVASSLPSPPAATWLLVVVGPRAPIARRPSECAVGRKDQRRTWDMLWNFSSRALEIVFFLIWSCC